MLTQRTNPAPLRAVEPKPHEDPKIEAKLAEMSDVMDKMFYGERDVLTVALSERSRVRVHAAGPYGLREVDALLSMLQAQREAIRAAQGDAP